jgi:hypothetical protein
MRKGIRALGVCLLVAVATVVAILAPIADSTGARRSIPAPWGWLSVIALAAVALLLRELRQRRRGGRSR